MPKFEGIFDLYSAALILMTAGDLDYPVDILAKPGEYYTSESGVQTKVSDGKLGLRVSGTREQMQEFIFLLNDLSRRTKMK